MSFVVLLVLCVIQGLTEFLPVSSSGHLLFFEQLFGITDNLLFINLFLHLATLLAVIVVYRKVVWNLIKKPFQPLMYKLVISTAITVMFALLYKLLDIDIDVTSFYWICFLVTAGLLFAVYKFQKNGSTIKTGGITTKDSVVVGLVQGFAVLPGISRSGSTISALMLMGNDESQSAEYSFLLSIPIILGGFVVELFEIKHISNVFAGFNTWWCLVAFALTFVVALLSLKLTIKFLKEKKFKWFAIYMLVMGIAVAVCNLLVF